MGRLSRLFNLLSDPRAMRTLAALHHTGYLAESGWFEARNRKESVGKDLEPLPWVTYPFLRFIDSRLTTEMDLFEFGSGNSTLYFARRVRSVVSAEHDREWVEKIKSSIPQNVEIRFVPLEPKGIYAKTATRTGKGYDVIVVDGRDRVQCVRQSVEALKENGVLVLDDSERPEYREAASLMKGHDFKRIDFWGIAPGIEHEKCTTIFYRSSRNCLNI
jgi:hypothetical protein